MSIWNLLYLTGNPSIIKKILIEQYTMDAHQECYVFALEVLRFIAMPLTERKRLILKILSKKESSIAEILEKLAAQEFLISKMTLNRELKALETANLILRIGHGKASKYKLSKHYKLIQPIDFADYFSVHSDDRKVQEGFDFKIFSELNEIFSKNERLELDKLNSKYRSNIAKSSQSLTRKELERLVIELSWKSSKLEGNTYSLLDTEKLIKKKIETKGHSHEEAVMILNHKKALDYIIENKISFRKITLKQIEKIHRLLAEGLDIQLGLRSKKVGILGTKYKPLRAKIEIRKAVTELCKSINKETYPLAKALIALVMLSYIQAFEDGNKRTARLVSTAILLAWDYCPLSYRNVDDFDYKKSLILFYEQNNLLFMKRLFVDQFRFSVDEYF